METLTQRIKELQLSNVWYGNGQITVKEADSYAVKQLLQCAEDEMLLCELTERGLNFYAR